MNVFRESLRLILTTPLCNSQIGELVSRSPNTIKRYRAIAEEKQIEWDKIQEMDDRSIMALLNKYCGYNSKKRLPDWSYIHSQKLMADVSLQLLWEDYCLDGPEDAYGYSSFTEHYREFVSKLDLSMRQTHQAGKVTFVDFAGRRIPYYPPGKPKKLAEVFVGVLGSSKYTFAHACDSQKLHDWIDAHNRMFMFFGGVTETVIPDNLKSAVTQPGAEPKLNRTYREMAVHYGTVIVPARVRRPQDKSHAEIGVQIVTRWIIAALRHRKFFSLQEINEEIAKRLVLLNERPFKKLPGCRRDLFERIEKPQLMLLPETIFEPTALWTAEQKVHSDYHVHVDRHYYSVPHQLVGSKVEARKTHDTVEIFCLGKRVAIHARSDVAGGHTTLPEHQPIAHRKYAEQTPEYFQDWAEKIGDFTTAFVEHQLSRTPYNLPGIRVCSCLMKLGKEYGTQRLEAACERAQQIGSLTLKSVKSILRRNLDGVNDPRIPVQGQLPLHYNVRGPRYYSQEG
ncbi:MAG: IS21 family transposase [Gammaproteobacteria bacterium]|nr:IS21 family transposase [Gammaproteobacteria bacterium]